MDNLWRQASDEVEREERSHVPAEVGPRARCNSFSVQHAAEIRSWKERRDPVTSSAPFSAPAVARLTLDLTSSARSAFIVLLLISRIKQKSSNSPGSADQQVSSRYWRKIWVHLFHWLFCKSCRLRVKKKVNEMYQRCNTVCEQLVS